MSWLRVRFPVPAPRLRVLCFAYAGGGATVFHTWHGAFGPDVEVVAVQLPGRQERLAEPALDDVDALLDGVERALDARPPAPLALVGVSFGGHLAWDLARRRVAERPRLVLLASRAPHLPARTPLLHPLGDADFLVALGERYGTSLAMFREPELWRLAGPPLRADIRAMERRIHPGERLPLGATLLRGAADPLGADQGAAAWATALGGELHEEVVPGGHFFVDTHRAETLARVVRALG